MKQHQLLVCRNWRRTCLLLVLWLTAISANAQWIPRANAFRTRSEVSSVVYGGKVYTFTGFSNALLEAEPSSEVYDPATNTWTLLADFPTGRTVTHQGVALIDNTVWHLGGRVGQNPGPLTSEVWIYNITTNSWSPGPPLIDPATGAQLRWAGCGAALLGRTLHVFGGFVINACNNDQDRYHLTLDVDRWLANPTTTWENKLQPLPLKRNHFSTTVLGGKIYAIGGQFDHDCNGAQDQAFCHAYNPATDSWTQLTSLPTARSHAEGGVFPLDGKIYLVAGQGNGGAATNFVTVFDPAANGGLGSWTELPDFAVPNNYEGISAKVIDNTFIISHGGISNSSNTQQTTYSRTIARNPVYQLGFSASTLHLRVPAGGRITGKNLLFTIDGSKDYTTTSTANWLSVSENSTGTAIQMATDVEVTVNAAALAPGTYSAVVQATGTGGGPAYTSASFTVNLTVESAVRINAGGESTTVNGVTWSGCGAPGASCNNYVTGGFAYAQLPAPAITGVTAPATPALLQTEWTGGQTAGVPAGAVAFSYNIPLANGNYIVRLHFVELNKNGPGLRVFDVNLEGGAKELTNFDIFVEANGMNKAIVRDFPVTITDGNVTIDFIRQVENAKIGAIEVLPAVPAAVLYEAEEAALSQVVVAANQPGYTGTGFVNYLNANGDYIEWTVNQLTAGATSLQFRYANGGTTNRPLRLVVNGGEVSASMAFAPTGSWFTWGQASATASLNAGLNTVRLTAIGSSGPNVDHLLVDPGTVASMPGRQLEGSWSVFPNPASQSAQLVIYNAVEGPARVSITDLLGRVHRVAGFTKTCGRFHYTLPLDHLAPGVYLVSLDQKDSRSTTRLIVK